MKPANELPEWIEELIEQDHAALSCEEVPSGFLAYKALAIAWEALECRNHNLGRCFQCKPCEAMRKIAALGESK